MEIPKHVEYVLTILEAAGHAVQCAFTGLGEFPWVQEMYQERLTALLKTI